MNKSLLILGACAAAMIAAPRATAQDVVVEESVVVTENIPCKTHYYTTAGDNWFIQLGAGINAPMVDNATASGHDGGLQMTAAYNLAVGKWFSPYFAWRFNTVGGAIHWKNVNFDKAKYVNASVEVMWDMFNTFKVNPKRVFSIVPFVGVGGTYVWDYANPQGNDVYRDGTVRTDQWLLPVSAGLQFRFRLCRYVDFFAEGRFQLYGDNFNNTISGDPIEANLTAIGGFNINIGGSDFNSYNPCDYLGYIKTLNNQVNDLRADLVATAAALAAVEAQLPCPEVAEVDVDVQPMPATPLLSTVRFNINSDAIADYELVNVYNIAQWMKTNPDANVVIAGYADKDTGTAEYNQQLSKRRAEAVRTLLVNKYGIKADRLTIQANGSSAQPYSQNDWNRIVIFSNK